MPFLFLFHLILQFSTPCPASNELHHYVTAPLRILENNHSGQVQIYYRLLKPFDPTQPTLLIIGGGPPSRSEMIKFFSHLASEINIVSFDHREVGCTKILSNHAGFYEKGLFAMSRAADDLEAIRKDLLGEDGNWFVYGVSYGGMLAQQYAIQHSENIVGLILDSTFQNTSGMTIARNQFLSLFVHHDPEIKKMFYEIWRRFPHKGKVLLRRVFSYSYGYYARTVMLKKDLKRILEANEDEAEQLLKEWPTIPYSDVSRGIVCEEIFDYPRQKTGFFFDQAEEDCPLLFPWRHPMAFDKNLITLPIKTLILGGRFDPVTPIQMMRAMSKLIPNTFLYENIYAGHALIREKPGCTLKLMKSFVEGEDVQPIAHSEECQSPPAPPSLQAKFLKEDMKLIGFPFPLITP